jgi:hypothetical protein
MLRERSGVRRELVACDLEGQLEFKLRPQAVGAGVQGPSVLNLNLPPFVKVGCLKSSEKMIEMLRQNIVIGL